MRDSMLLLGCGHLKNDHFRNSGFLSWGFGFCRLELFIFENVIFEVSRIHILTQVRVFASTSFSFTA